MNDSEPRPLTWLQGATAAMLASLASLTLIGYRFGDSNHGITVPILKRFIDRSLYPGDALVATGEAFPTIFYRLLATFLPSTDWVPFAYFALYVVSIALTYAAVFRMAVWASGGDRSIGALAVVLAMPVRTGLAGEALYRVAFSHSHLASGLDLMALALFLEGRRLLALALSQLDRGRVRALSVLAFVLTIGPLVVDNFNRQRERFEQGSFRASQNWARENTPKNALFLTPPKEAGFRVFSERSIVGEWKDGTQQYFDDGFAKEWGARMETVMAQEFGKYTDEEIVALAQRFGADYLVGQGRRRRLPIVFDGGSTIIYSVQGAMRR